MLTFFIFQRIIDTAVRQWRTRLHACVKANGKRRPLWAVEWVGTSAQIGYTVPFTSVYDGKYWQKTNQKQTLLKLSTTQKRQTTQNTTKQNYPGSVAFYDTRLRNEVGLFYNAPSLHGATTLSTNCLD